MKRQLFYPSPADGAAEAIWDLSAYVADRLDAVNESRHGWAAVNLPGLPTVSLAFLLEHLSAELERIAEGVRDAE